MADDLNLFVAKKAQEMFRAEKQAREIAKRVPPLGMERVPAKDFPARYRRMGDDARRAFRRSLATPEDPEGVAAVMRLLETNGA